MADSTDRADSCDLSIGKLRPAEIRTGHRPLVGSLELFQIESSHLRGNPLGDAHIRDVLVYLPPRYCTSDDRFPLVMLLPAFGSNPWSLVKDDLFSANVIESLDAMVAGGTCAPCILAIPDATCRLIGSQYVDSPFTGAYQSFLADEVLPALESRFRCTLGPSGRPGPHGRAIVGRSSGGFGALRMAIDRPGLFGAVASHAGDAAFELSLKPMFVNAAIAYNRKGGLMAFAESLSNEAPASPQDFDGLFVLAAAAAYSAGVSGHIPPLTLSELAATLALPFSCETGEVVAEIWETWKKHDPVEILRQNPASLNGLTQLYLDAGDADEHGLQFASRQIVQLLAPEPVKVCYEEFRGGHRGTRARYLTSIPTLLSALAEQSW